MRPLICKCGAKQFSKAGMLHSVSPPWDGWACSVCHKVTFVSREEPHIYEVFVTDDAQIMTYAEEPPQDAPQTNIDHVNVEDHEAMNKQEKD